MRVLMTTDTVGGVWTFTRELTEGLLAQGCSVMLVSFGRLPSADQSAWADRVVGLWPEHFRYLPTAFALEWMQGNDSFYSESAELLLSAAEHFRADLLHSNQLCYGALVSDRPTIVTVHSDVRSWFAACRGAEPEPSPWMERYDRLVGRGLRTADSVVAPTVWMLTEVQRHYGPLRNARVVPNGRDLPERPSADARRMQAVTVGRLWDEGKDLALMEDIASPMPLLIAGELTGHDAARELPGQHMEWLGQLSEAEVLDLFRRSTVYVVTSRYEPFGLAPLEAALCGCALVARDLPSLREVWADAALYFRDAAELSRILEVLAGDEQRVREMAERATARGNDRFGRAQMTATYLALYRATIEARRGGVTERHVA